MSESENLWMYKGEPFSAAGLEAYAGYIYIITNNSNGRKYIGQKKLWSHKYTVKYFKNGKKGRQKVIIPSDWPKYYGSSKELQDDVILCGKENFTREVLKLCKTKGMMNYEELCKQVYRDVLRDPMYYNSYIGGRIHRNHLQAND